MIKNLNRFLGIGAILILVVTRISTYSFYKSWTPITLILILSISIFLEIYFRVKTQKALERLITVSLITFALIIWGLVKIEPLLNHGWLSLGSSKTFINDEYKIVGSKPLFGKNKNIRSYTLYEFGIGGILIREQERVEGVWNDTIDLVSFPESGLKFNHITNEIIKP